MAMTLTAETSGNHLIDFLDGSSNTPISLRMEKVSLSLRDVCYEANHPIKNIYFPLNGIISWVQDVGGGKQVEVATVGNEGFVGVPVLLGADRTPGKSFSQIPGEALRIRVEDFHELLASFPRFAGILHRYVQALVVQIAQGNACNGSHSVEERCARWLLMTQDRVGKPEFFLTQEFLAQMLGVRRTGVNEVAKSFQDAGIIRYARGDLTILNRSALEARSCMCYRIVRDEFRRMLRDLGDDQ
jgi:CRP-like cAMP-binding protein